MSEKTKPTKEGIAEIDDSIILSNSNIIKGGIKNPYHKSISSFGFIGQGKYDPKENNKIAKSYFVWCNMLNHCYGALYKEQCLFSKDFEVHKDWLNFQNFAKWYEENFDETIMSDWHLSKNILIKKNKMYSSETCCFVPQEISNLLLKCDKNRGKFPIGVSYSKNNDKYIACCSIEGILKYIGTYNTPENAFFAYKKVKEAEIKRIANKWKDKIDSRIYEALINYEVEITD